MKGANRSGPAPDPNALRRERPSDQAGWTHLPVEGRQGDPPPWPLSRPRARELQVWVEEWRRPQAVMWERLRLEREVAIYVRSLTVAEQPKASVASRTLLRQQQEALGLSVPGLNRLRWSIGSAARQQPQQRATGTEGPSMRDRLRAIEGGL